MGADPAQLERKPFDHYARYRLAADVADAVRGAAPLRILDVGGGPGSLAAFLPDDRITATDLEVPSGWFTTAPDLVVATGAALPFADGAFDLVTTLDTLEHVPPAVREGFLAECRRVSRGWVLVVCPCATPGVADADEALRRYVRHRFGPDFPTTQILDEHLDHGHPDPAVVERVLAADGAEVARFGSGRLDRWLPMMVLFFHLLALGDDAVVEGVQAWYNRLLYRDDLRDPAYRQAFLARRAGASGPAVADVLARVLPGEVPTLDAGALAVVQLGLESLAAELLAERTAERDRLAQERDAAAGRADAAEGRAAEAVAQLGGMQQRLEEVERQLAAVRAERDALAAFRDRVLDHPALRARRLVKRLLGR